jgi:myo-inositol 2-dehydrogenase/D-chiro-inositol 1-dehydrogenase/scyllo-inositol 2-dehydrogenase (NAD+)
MNLRMKNGTIGCIEGAQGVQYGYDAQVEILGTSGVLRIGDLSGNSTVTFTADHRYQGDIVRSWTDLFAEAYVKEDESFLESVKKGSKPMVTGYDGMMAVDIVRAGNESIKTKHIIYL